MKQAIIIILSLVMFSCNNSTESKIYTENDLINKTTKELRLLRNEIFARHGYIFKSQDLQDYFAHNKWYKPDFKNVDSLLTEIDKSNIQLILNIETQLKQKEKVKLFFNTNRQEYLADYSMPYNVSDIIEKLGKPNSTYIDGDELNSVGQLHYWVFPEINLEFSCLGDKYGNEIDLNAKSRVAGIKVLNIEEVVNHNTVFGTKLGQSESEINETLKKFCSVESTYRLEKYEGETILDRFYSNSLKVVYWLTNENDYYHFGINSNGKLEFIIHSNFNIRAAG